MLMVNNSDNIYRVKCEGPKRLYQLHSPKLWTYPISYECKMSLIFVNILGQNKKITVLVFISLITSELLKIFIKK